MPLRILPTKGIECRLAVISYRKWSCRQMVCVTYVSEGKISYQLYFSSECFQLHRLLQKEKQIVQYSWVKLLMGTVFYFFIWTACQEKWKKEGRKYYGTLLGWLVSSFRDNSDFSNINFLKCPSPHKVVTINQHVVHSNVIYMPLYMYMYTYKYIYLWNYS